jgi:orotidine 5'-phosphate decarboxylase subfamily 1
METLARLGEPQLNSRNAGLDARGRRDPLDRLIVALDFPSAEAAMDIADQLQGTCRWFKVGMELYYAAGNAVVARLRERGFEVFLDLKLHDIPNTVAGAVRSVAGVGASLLTVHAAGGERMLRAAAQAASAPGSLKLLAITVLTSMDAAELSAVGVGDTPVAQVLRLAQLARAAGIDRCGCGRSEPGRDPGRCSCAWSVDAGGRAADHPGSRPGKGGRRDSGRDPEREPADKLNPGTACDQPGEVPIPVRAIGVCWIG